MSRTSVEPMEISWKSHSCVFRDVILGSFPERSEGSRLYKN